MIYLGPRKGRFKIDDKEQNRATTGSQNGVTGRSQNKPRDNRTTSMQQEVMDKQQQEQEQKEEEAPPQPGQPVFYLMGLLNLWYVLAIFLWLSLLWLFFGDLVVP